MEVPLTPEYARMVEKLVSSGRYLTPGEVVRDALDLLEDQDVADAKRLERLKAKLQRGLDELDAGLGIPGDVAFERLRQRSEQTRKQAS